MVPLSLKLSNFTSYTNPPELDFTHFRLAAISGSNGAGKSSLLDAITWCVWGSSRAGESSDPLVHAGANQMWVEFTFSLDGTNYTIKRSRSKKGNGTSTLELWSNSHNLTEGTIKATQEKIIHLLHLSFETFSNSSFLRQGHADEFTVKGPTERKKILADILGLDHYDILEDRAKEKIKEIQTKLQLLDYQILEIDAELSQKGQREENLSKIEKEGQETQKKLKEVEEEYKKIEGEYKEIELLIKSLREKEETYMTVKIELEHLSAQIELKRISVKEYQAVLDKKMEIEKGYELLQILFKKQKTFEGKRSSLIKAKDELADIQKRLIDRESKRTEAISELKKQISNLQILSSDYSSHLQTLKTKAICPTCGQSISQAKNKQLINKLSEQLSQNKTKEKELTQLIKKYQIVILPEQKLAREKETVVIKLENETKEWSELQNKIDLQNRYSQDILKLKEAEAGVKAHTEAISDLEKIAISKKAELNQVEGLEAKLGQHLESLNTIEQKLSAQALVKEDLTQKLLDLRDQYGEAKHLVSRTSQLESLSKQKVEEKKKLLLDQEIYTELSLAFGKKGIQAMIIEQAIPEIEEETNLLLERLTAGRMKVRFDTQKETRTTHSTIETLEIIISDEMGEREYSLYSGGEAFRVNFAIRLAISKLMAHRAGAKLQFLVIDEGFGTQDVEGRTRLVEAIDTIKNDFEKILIITHLEELKEEFPTRIEVTKNSTGSIFEIVGS